MTAPRTLQCACTPEGPPDSGCYLHTPQSTRYSHGTRPKHCTPRRRHPPCTSVQRVRACPCSKSRVCR
eukprot:239242-Prymnesium_polylepis.3